VSSIWSYQYLVVPARQPSTFSYPSPSMPLFCLLALIPWDATIVCKVSSQKLPLSGTLKVQLAEFLSSSPLLPYSTYRRIPNKSSFANPIRKLIPRTKSFRSPLVMPLAATIWQTSAESFESKQIPVQFLAVDVPTRLCARLETDCLRWRKVTGTPRQSSGPPNVFATVDNDSFAENR
jgi:hypothetical protein